MASRLRTDIIYRMTVTHILEPKQIPPKAGESRAKYVFKIGFVDSQGETFIGEYITFETWQEHFVQHLPTTFKVIEVQQYGDIILPLPESKQVEEKAIRTDMIGSIAGTTFSAAALIAKDIFISSRGAEEMDDKAWEEYFGMVDKVDAYLIHKYTKKVLGE
jgi:hypothetical protein